MAHREEKIIANLKKLSAEFLGQRAGKQSLITVTDCQLSDSGKRGTVFMTILPESAERSALEFAKRQRQELRAYIGEHLRLGHIPQLDFAIDEGEKHRQRIEELLK